MADDNTPSGREAKQPPQGDDATPGHGDTLSDDQLEQKNKLGYTQEDDEIEQRGGTGEGGDPAPTTPPQNG